MKKILLAAVGLTVFLTTAVPANALSFSPPNGTIFDFGDVTVGTTATQTFTFIWSHDSNDGYHMNYLLLSAILSPFEIQRTTAAAYCFQADTACDFSLSFSPTALGFVSKSTVSLSTSFGPGMIGFNSTSGADVVYDITLQGTGASSVVPLPGALPLFAAGLGALGLLGWRRKKKAATLAA